MRSSGRSDAGYIASRTVSLDGLTVIGGEHSYGYNCEEAK